MWSAAEGNRQCWTLECLASRADLLPPVTVGGVEVPGREVAITGWEVLHNAMRSWCTESREPLGKDPPPRFSETKEGSSFQLPCTRENPQLCHTEGHQRTVFESLYAHMVLHGLPSTVGKHSQAT